MDASDQYVVKDPQRFLAVVVLLTATGLTGVIMWVSLDLSKEFDLGVFLGITGIGLIFMSLGLWFARSIPAGYVIDRTKMVFIQIRGVSLLSWQEERPIGFFNLAVYEKIEHANGGSVKFFYLAFVHQHSGELQLLQRFYQLDQARTAAARVADFIGVPKHEVKTILSEE